MRDLYTILHLISKIKWLNPHLVDAFLGMVTKKGRFGTDPYINFFRKRTPSPTDAFSGMVTKKGRFGTDPYINFLKKGTAKTKPSPSGRGSG